MSTEIQENISNEITETESTNNKIKDPRKVAAGKKLALKKQIEEEKEEEEEDSWLPRILYLFGIGLIIFVYQDRIQFSIYIYIYI